MTAVDPTRIDIRFDPTQNWMTGIARHGNVPFSVPFISHIEGNLWMGGCDGSLVLPEHIEHVVSLYKWENYRVNHKLKSHKQITMYDSSDTPNERDVLDAARLVNKCVEDGPTLVHCQAGLNRSGLVAAASLMLRGWTAKDAVALLREKRSNAVLCNKTFYFWLKELENRLTARK